MHKTSILGISGHAGSGKDTVADYLVQEYKFVRVAWADPIKRFAYNVFLFSEKQLWGPSNYRDTVDPRYSHKAAWDEAQGRIESWGHEFCQGILGTDDVYAVEKAYKSLVHWFFWLKTTHPKLSPRVALQSMGTEWGREAVKDSLWVDALLRTTKTLLHEDGSTRTWAYDPVVGIFADQKAGSVRGVVVSDVRFPNEVEAIKKDGGSIIRLSRPETDSLATSIGISDHASEVQEFSADDFDFLVNNDGTLKELRSNIDLFMSTFFSSHH